MARARYRKPTEKGVGSRSYPGYTTRRKDGHHRGCCRQPWGIISSRMRPMRANGSGRGSAAWLCSKVPVLIIYFKNCRDIAIDFAVITS